TIRNGSSINASANATLTTLYNKVPFFKKVNEKYQSSSRRYGSKSKATPSKNASKDTPEKAGKTKEVKYKEKGVSFKTDIPKSIFHKLGTEKVRVVVLSAAGDTIKGEATVVNENRVNFKSKSNVKDAEVTIIGVIDNSEPLSKKILYRTTRVLLGVQSLRASYTESGGTELPGFLGEPQVLHFGSQNFTDLTSAKSSLAPGLPFLFGWQNDDFASIAAENGWITKDTTVSKQFLNQKTMTWSLGATIEPIPNLKIEVTGTRRESSNKSGYIQYNTSLGAFEQYSKKETGNFDMTIFTLRTAFREGLSRDSLNSSGLFNQFKENRQIIVDRLNAQRGYVNGQGYSKSPYSGDTVSYVSPKSSDVIIPALLATYTGIKPSKIPLSARPGIAWIRPNWRINYNGNPQSIDWMKDLFTSLNFTHSYRSTYSIGSYETNLAYRTDDSGFSWVKTTLSDESYFVPQLDITSVNIQEDLNPLINIDASFVNDLSASFEINRTRNLNFSFTNMQLSEMIKNEFSVGLGYRFTGMDMIIKTKKKSETVSNDVNLRLDLTSSDYKTIFRKIDSDKGLLQSGTRIFSIDFQADYMISDKLTIKLYYNYKLQDPHSPSGSEGYMQKDTKFGLSFNYSIM
ncbi:MAG TPA: cell surface protein SprA, partial [Prolixibacteraceae bacterium]|nr:cell surface protein SprA [Prolixibacteraceae bacterium]